jgi:alpha-tubulin suppressor-like RCC1 family protein
VKLAFTIQPSAVVAGTAMTPAVKVTVQDASGNAVTTATYGITLTITSGTGTAGAVLGGTLTSAAVGGVATFPDLTVDKAGPGYHFTATAAGLASATSGAFATNPGAAAQLAFTTQPSAVVAGTAMIPAVQVTVQDALGNTVTTATHSVTLAITNGTGTAGAVLGGTLSTSAVEGVATFGDLTMDKVGSGYTLTAAAGALASTTSGAFAATPGAAAKLAFTVQPSGVVAGAAMSPAVQVTVQDAHANLVNSATHSISLAITSGTGTLGAVLGGTRTAAAVNGVATFGTLSLDKAGAGYTLTAAAAGLTSATSGAFATSAGAAARLAFSVQPSAVLAGALISPAVQVTVQDALSNTVPTATHTVTLGVTSGTGTAGAILGGTLTSTAVAGVATFGDLTLDRMGPDYRLTASAAGVTGATSGAFLVRQVALLVATGGGQTCGLAIDGRAFCWGWNNYGQVGDGTRTDRAVPTAVAGGLVFTRLALGIYHSCGLTAGGAAYCWGENFARQLGDSTLPFSSSPVPVSGGLTFTEVYAGARHTCGLTAGGQAYCWGQNDKRQLGTSDTSSWVAKPAAVLGGLVLGQLSLGYYHTCGLTTTGEAYCWGSNALGQFGTGDTLSGPTPRAVAGGFRFTRLAAGIGYTCGLVAGGAAYCWGANDAGQLGDGSTVYHSVPGTVSGGLSFEQLPGGVALHACGSTSAGNAYCWGENGNGQLGDGSTQWRNSPARVVGGLTFIALAVGTYTTCGLSGGGRIYCWGWGFNGSLGTGASADSPIPLEVLGF